MNKWVQNNEIYDWMVRKICKKTSINIVFSKKNLPKKETKEEEERLKMRGALIRAGPHIRDNTKKLSKPHHFPCPPVRDWCCRVYGLLIKLLIQLLIRLFMKISNLNHFMVLICVSMDSPKTNFEGFHIMLLLSCCHAFMLSYHAVAWDCIRLGSEWLSVTEEAILVEVKEKENRNMRVRLSVK